MNLKIRKFTGCRFALAAPILLTSILPLQARAAGQPDPASPQPEIQAAVDAAVNAPKQIGANLNPPCAACTSIPGLLTQQHKPTPLFSDDKPLELTLTADFRAENASFKGTKFPGTIELVENGKKEKITADFAVRGNYKQAVCSDFKPIRVYFHPDAHDTKDTIFGDIKEEMKIGTHCKGWGQIDDSSEYVQGMLREYTGYKALNAMGLMSLQVRLARITYKDPQGNILASSYAFLEEPKGAMAKRFKEQNISQAEAAQLNKEIGVRERVPFDVENEFMEDSDKFYGGTHNGIFVAPKGSKEPNAIVPYDYDLSGFAHTPYAYGRDVDNQTAESERSWFQGYCPSRNNPPECRADLLSTAQYVLKHKQAVVDAIAKSPVLDKTRMEARVQVFFDGLRGFINHPDPQ